MKRFIGSIIFLGLLFVGTTSSANTGTIVDPTLNPTFLNQPTNCPQGVTGVDCYQLLEPIPLASGPVTSIDTTAQGQDSQGLGGFINFMFEIGIGIAGVIAVVMLVIYGFRYAANDKNISEFSNLREKITNVILGLLLLLGTFVILKTINPDLLIVEPDITKATLDAYTEYLKETGATVSFKDFTQYIKSEYIPTRDIALPNITKGMKILITAHAQMEGFYPGSKSYRTNNPGNIGNDDLNHLNPYPTLTDGIKAQYAYINRVATGQHQHYKVGTFYPDVGFTYTGTLDQYLKIYATGARTSPAYVNLMIAAFKQGGYIITKDTLMSDIIKLN